MEKVSKADVDYREGRGTRECQECEYYDSGTCQKVRGLIRPDMLCDLFDRRESGGRDIGSSGDIDMDGGF